jgi:NitT/TauT family transport system substrate-binding protein
MNKSIGWVMALAAALGIYGQPAQGQGTRVVFAIPTTTLTLSSFFIAKDAGLFAKEGLAVEERVIVGVGSVNAVISGSADFTVSSGSSFSRAIAEGQKLQGLGIVVNKPMVELVLRKDVAAAEGITAQMPIAERAKRLKGKTIAIQGVGSAVHVSQRLIAAAGGLDIENDVRISPMDPPAMLVALKTKQIDGFATSLPFTTQAIVDGSAVVLASLPMDDLPKYNPMAYLLLMTRPEVCRDQRAKCVGVGRALTNAVKMMHERQDEVRALLKKRFNEMDQKVFDEAWKVALEAHPRSLNVTEAALQNAQLFGVDAKLEDPNKSIKDFSGYFTNEFLN